MTFLQLRNAVLDNTQRTDKISVINNAINFALLEIAKVHEWRALRVQVDLDVNPNDLSTPMPAGFYKIDEIRLINPESTVLSYPMALYPKLKFIKQWPNVVAYGSGRPFVGYMDGSTVYYYPKSSQQYLLRCTYITLPATLVADNDMNPIVEVDMPIIQWATAYLFGSVQMFDAANVWMQTYLMSLQESIRSEKRDVGVTQVLEKFDQDSAIVNTSPEPWNDPFAGHR